MSKKNENIDTLLANHFSGEKGQEGSDKLRVIFNSKSPESKQLLFLESQFHKRFDKSDDEQTMSPVTDNREVIWNQLQLQRERGQKRIHKLWRTFQRISAILIVPIIFAYMVTLFQNSNKSESAYAEIQCPLGTRTKFELPDGSVGYINSGSKLRYAVDFSNSRDVTVVGEAYFDVAHNKEVPFIVHTPHLNVKVLGTEFNVLAYEDDITEEVVLSRGSVEILSPDGRSLSKLKPNERIHLNTETMKLKKESVEASQYSSWIDGKLVFRNETMEQVTERLSRWYNADIIIVDKELLNYTFRATFTDEPIEEVLKLLALSAPLKFEEKKREVSKNSIYKKKVIEVRLDTNISELLMN